VTSGERRAIPLDGVRADGWFESLAARSPSFDKLCEVVGRRFVAFAVVADVHVTALTVDRQRPEATVVEFQVGESLQAHRLPLNEFRRRVAAALVAEEPAPPPLPEGEVDAAALQAILGAVPLLLAPVYGIRLLELRMGGTSLPSVAFERDSRSHEVTVGALRELIRDLVRADVRQVSGAGGGFSVDLGAVAEAEAANARADWQRTIELLGAWPGPLSVFMRSPEGQRLDAQACATIARGLGLLGTAHVCTGRADWAEEILRFAIQWSQEGSAAADLYRRLGETHVAQERHGEAIGPLRRALALGAQPREVLPVLARCYAVRGRYVAAAACLDEARALGVQARPAEEAGTLVAERLGAAWKRFRQLVPVRDGSATTTPPPPPTD
jgi:hypothetical protein